MEPGQTKQELLDQHNMGKPDAYDMKKISDNEVVEVFYYQVASKTCEWASKKTYLFEPIVVQNDVITGIGGQAYERLFNQAQAQEKRSKKEGGIFYNQLLSFASFN